MELQKTATVEAEGDLKKAMKSYGKGQKLLPREAIGNSSEGAAISLRLKCKTILLGRFNYFF